MTCWRRLEEWSRARVWQRLHEFAGGVARCAVKLDWSRGHRLPRVFGPRGVPQNRSEPGGPRPPGPRQRPDELLTMTITATRCVTKASSHIARLATRHTTLSGTLRPRTSRSACGSVSPAVCSAISRRDEALSDLVGGGDSAFLGRPAVERRRRQVCEGLWRDPRRLGDEQVLRSG